jgi:hypothetical protein
MRESVVLNTHTGEMILASYIIFYKTLHPSYFTFLYLIKKLFVLQYKNCTLRFS